LLDAGDDVENLEFGAADADAEGSGLKIGG